MLLLAFITIPWMLIAKPYFLYKEHQRSIGAGYHTTGEDSPDSAPPANDNSHGGHGEVGLSLFTLAFRFFGNRYPSNDPHY